MHSSYRLSFPGFVGKDHHEPDMRQSGTRFPGSNITIISILSNRKKCLPWFGSTRMGTGYYLYRDEWEKKEGHRIASCLLVSRDEILSGTFL